MFIAIEGIDGSGKTTLSDMLRRSLEQHGKKVVLTREPTDNFHITAEESARRDVDTAMKLFFRFTWDRFVHQRFIEDKLKSGSIVISDRYLASSLAYQGPLIEPAFGTPEKTIEWMYQVSRIISLRPDITFYIDVDPSTAMSRIKSRASFSGFENGQYLESVRRYYRLLLNESTVVLDGRKELEELVREMVDRICPIS